MHRPVSGVCMLPGHPSVLLEHEIDSQSGCYLFKGTSLRCRPPTVCSPHIQFELNYTLFGSNSDPYLIQPLHEDGVLCSNKAFLRKALPDIYTFSSSKLQAATCPFPAVRFPFYECV